MTQLVEQASRACITALPKCCLTHCIPPQDKQQQAECAEKLTAEVRWLEGQADEAGPFFLGSDFSLVDATMAPWFLRQVGCLAGCAVAHCDTSQLWCGACLPGRVAMQRLLEETLHLGANYVTMVAVHWVGGSNQTA
jgi:glutathione S-transferase